MLAYIAILSLALSAAAEPFIVGIERVRGAPGPADLSSWNAHTYNIDATRRNLLVKRFIVDYDRSTHGISEYRANLTRRQQGLDPPASSRTAKASPILITASAPQAEYAVGLDVFAPPGLPSVPLGYVVPVQTAGKTLRYMLDTTSHTTWTASHKCLSCPESKDRRLPDNIKMDGEPFAIEYATDASWVAGKLARVDLSFGEGLDLPGFTLGAALFRTSKWHGSPVDGYIGLGLSALRPDGKKGIPTPLEALKASGKISAAKMGFAFGRIEDGQTDGEISFGEPDISRYTGDLKVTKNAVDNAGLWAVPLIGVQSGTGQMTNLPKAMVAYIDTQSELIIAPIDIATQLHAQIQGAQSDGMGSFFIPCTTASTISLALGGATISLLASDLAYIPQPDGTCLSSIVGAQASMWILGQPFLRNAYLVIDADDRSISLAPRAA